MMKNTTMRRGLATACAGLGLFAMSAVHSTFAQSVAPATPVSTGGAAAGCAPGSAQQSLSERLAGTYKDYLAWDGDPADTPPNWREGYAPPPVSSAPMPFANWPIGGTENIGYENMYYAPNTVQMDQVALYLERTPDVVQKDHFDWGFRLATLWGTDAKYTYSRGLFSNQFSNGNGKVAKYGYDIPMAYVEGYFPNVGDGMNVRVGRYISVPDIEAQLAPNNYTYSHSLLYSYDPYTQEGIVATIKLNKNWAIQPQLNLGNDVAGWYKQSVPQTYVNAAGNTVHNPNAGQEYGSQVTPALCVQWTSDSGNDAIYPCLNGAKPIGNSGNFGWNNIQHEVVTWYHKFNDQWHISSEAWYMYQKNTPNMQNVDGPALWNSYFGTTNSVGGPFGAMGGRGCGPNDGVTCTSKEWAFVNYVIYQPTPRDYFAFRTDIFDDTNGQRTGFATRYSEFLVSWNHWLGKAVTIRPEIRYEHAGVGAYNNPCPVAGTAGCGNTVTTGSKSQTMFAMDVIVHF